METPNDTPQEDTHKTASCTAARLLTDAEQTTDIRKQLGMLLDAGLGGDAATEQSAESKQDDLSETLDALVIADFLKGLLRHCTGKFWLVNSKLKDLVEKVVTSVTQSADALITRMLSVYDDQSWGRIRIS